MKAIKLQDRCLVCTVEETVKVTTPAVAAVYLLEQVFAPFAAFEQEEFWAFPLNARNHITHQVMVYRGTIAHVPVRLADVFRTAIRLNACSLLLAHNHPSGCAEPSLEDYRIHRSLCQAGELLGIAVVDHIIVGEQAWTSLRQRCEKQ